MPNRDFQNTPCSCRKHHAAQSPTNAFPLASPLKKIVQTLRRIITWFYHNLFMRLWLGFAGLIGISTVSTCPCCGQLASACPTGFSLIAGLAGILAVLGAFHKKARKSLQKIFPFLSDSGSGYVFWGLFGVINLSLIATGYLIAGKPLIIREWKAKIIISANTKAPPKKNISKKTVLSSTDDETSPIKSPIINDPKDSARGNMGTAIEPDGRVNLSEVTDTVIRFQTENFIEMTNNLYEHLDDNKGREVIVEGYVYRRYDFEPEYFVTARLYMWCCALDAVPVGPLCRWNNADSLNEGGWIRATGTIQSMYFDDAYRDENSDESGDIPVIHIEKIEKIPNFKSPYVYIGKGPPTPRPEHANS